MQVTTIGVDIAKNVFQVHGVDGDGTVVVRKKLRRSEMLSFFAKLTPCLVGMEACATAHHWARELGRLGHRVKLMPPSYVKPYVKRGKNDAVDAEAICEAVRRPTMRFVAVKSAERQAAQMVDLQGRITALERRLLAWHQDSEASRRLASIPGIGVITATALAATVTDPAEFKSGREFAAWIGLVPRQSSTGGKQRLGAISKMGNRYLRRLLVVGATALLRFAGQRRTPLTAWADDLRQRRPARLVSVALANKMARIAWAVLARGEVYRRPAPAAG